VLRMNTFTWSQNASGNRYIGTVLTTLENGQQAKVEQTQDEHGNITETRVYAYGPTPPPTSPRAPTPAASCSTCVRNLYDWSLWNGNVTSRGNVANRWVPGRSTSYTVYAVTLRADGAVPSVITPNNNTNLSVSLTYTPFLALTSASGPNGASIWTSYDAYGRPAGGGTTAVGGSSVGYAGNVATETKNGRWTRTTLDGLGRAIRVERGHGATTVSTQDTEYAPCACGPPGKVYRVSQP